MIKTKIQQKVDYKINLDLNDEISIKYNKMNIYLDPSHIENECLVFISHAHVDHLLNKKHLKKFELKKKIISSVETFTFANSRGYNITDYCADCNDLCLIDNGHMLGSKGLVIKDKIFYTGDISTRARSFLKKPEIPKVETLIIESTFGRPEYVFPPLDKIIHKVNMLISEMFSRGIPVILMGYSLGKAQILTSLFGSWKPLIVHDEIYKFNELYKKFGISLEESCSLSDAKEKEIIKKKPWILIYPLTNGKNSFITYLKEKYNAVTIGFSGWAINKNYCQIMNLDYVIPFSDHCDFKELVDVVKRSRPEKIFTNHGFQKDFAKYLNSIGFNAEPISNLSTKKIKQIKTIKNVNKTLDGFL
jgi:putative mRNA 3-end processing factor